MTLVVPSIPPEEEFGRLYGHRRMDGEAPKVGREVGSEEWGESVPPTCDWRKLDGVISSVKKQVPAPVRPSPALGVEGRRGQGPEISSAAPLVQESCSCCWAMAAAGNIEALWAIKYRQSVELSVQGMADRVGQVTGEREVRGARAQSTPIVPSCTRAARLWPLWGRLQGWLRLGCVHNRPQQQ